MEEYIEKLFSFSNIFGSIFWSLLVSAVWRLWLKYFRKATLDRRKEVTFWFLAPLGILALLSALNYVLTPRPVQQPPDLVLTLDRMNIGPLQMADGKPGPPYVTLLGGIRNRGGASIAESFTLTLTPPGGFPVPAQVSAIPEQFTLTSRNGNVELLHVADDLDLKTAQPIQRGGLARGSLFWVFPMGTQLNALTVPGTHVELGFSDVDGKRYSFIGTLTGQEDSLVLNLPKMTAQPIPVKLATGSFPRPQ